MKTLNRGFDIDELIRQLPPGLDRAILSVMKFHRGRENAISRADLVAKVNRMGYHIDERKLRAAISQMRIHERIELRLVLSTGGTDGGYWYAANNNEVHEWCKEPRSRANTLHEQASSVEKAAAEIFGTDPQIKLF